MKSSAPAWLSSLVRELQGTGDVVPLGWHTMKEYKKWLGKNTAKEAIPKLVKIGKMERKTFKQLCNGKIRLIPFYAVKGKR